MNSAQPEYWDFIIIGGGIAGASIGYELSPSKRVLLLEKEDACGYHTTGRSAATYIESLHQQTIFALSRASRNFLNKPPAGFATSPLLLKSYGCIITARESEQEQLQAAFQQGQSFGIESRILSAQEIVSRIPIIRSGPNTVHAGLYEPQAKRIDVDCLLQAYIRGLKANGGQLDCRVNIASIKRSNDLWQIQTQLGLYQAPIIINAAGAWADQVASAAGIEAIGLEPKKRTMVTFNAPHNMNISHWPMLGNICSSFYFLPEAGQLMGSPADENPAPPCDAQPDEIDVATAIYNIEQHTNLQIKKINHKWAGLRTFAPDRLPIVGFDPSNEGFFWFVGQGGYGIQIAPALAQLGKAIALKQQAEQQASNINVDLALLLPERFR